MSVQILDIYVWPDFNSTWSLLKPCGKIGLRSQEPKQTTSCRQRGRVITYHCSNHHQILVGHGPLPSPKSSDVEPLLLLFLQDLYGSVTCPVQVGFDSIEHILNPTSMVNTQCRPVKRPYLVIGNVFWMDLSLWCPQLVQNPCLSGPFWQPATIIFLVLARKFKWTELDVLRKKGEYIWRKMNQWYLWQYHLQTSRHSPLKVRFYQVGRGPQQNSSRSSWQRCKWRESLHLRSPFSLPFYRRMSLFQVPLHQPSSPDLCQTPMERIAASIHPLFFFFFFSDILLNEHLTYPYTTHRFFIFIFF